MKESARVALAAALMTEFADQTGISEGSEVQRRYLWTDAFAVCNFLELYRQTGDQKFKMRALLLVDQVHGILGRHREDDSRCGWISGLDEQEGRLHPTMGGLRIGKKMNECGVDDSLDDRLEWDRDGQYYHYLTKWMHALNRLSVVTEDPVYYRWAMELAKTAHARFTYAPFPGSPMRMYWKMSIDLSRPLVPSMGHHDPLDGLLTYLELQARLVGKSEDFPDLSEEITAMAEFCKGKDWATEDPLGIGGLLSDAYRAAHLELCGAFHRDELLATLLDACQRGLGTYARTRSLKLPAEYRLAFRELGLSIGLHAIERLDRLIEGNPNSFKNQLTLQRTTESLKAHLQLIEIIEEFWLDPANRKAGSYTEHLDINRVMLATSLTTDGYLAI
jgi:hypothetical protein